MCTYAIVNSFAIVDLIKHLLKRRWRVFGASGWVHRENSEGLALHLLSLKTWHSTNYKLLSVGLRTSKHWNHLRSFHISPCPGHTRDISNLGFEHGFYSFVHFFIHSLPYIFISSLKNSPGDTNARLRFRTTALKEIPLFIIWCLSAFLPLGIFVLFCLQSPFRHSLSSWGVPQLPFPQEGSLQEHRTGPGQWPGFLLCSA